MMDCDTTGVEPDIALIKYKKLVGEGFLKIVNQTVPAALRKLGYGAEEVDEILAYLTEHETIEGAPHLKPQHLPVFDCAFKPANGERSIHYMGHVRMMGAIQPFISGAISKTVNMPEAATAEEIEKVYLEGWKLGLKAIAVYRDNSKRSQPLSHRQEDRRRRRRRPSTPKRSRSCASSSPRPRPRPALPHRRRLPAERSAVTHKFDIAGHEGYITVGLYPDGQPGEIFLKMAKEGSTVSGLMDTFATTVSVALQYGVPLKDLVNKFAHVRFEPSGFTGNQEIPIAKSIVDYIFRWLGSRFLSPEDKVNLGLIDRTAVVADVPASSPGSATAPRVSGRRRPLGRCRARPPTLALTAARRRAAYGHRYRRPEGDRGLRANAVATRQAGRRAAGGHRDQRRSTGERSCSATGTARPRTATAGRTAPITLNLGQHQGQLPDPGRRPQLRRLRLDHGPQRQSATSASTAGAPAAAADATTPRPLEPGRRPGSILSVSPHHGLGRRGMVIATTPTFRTDAFIDGAFRSAQSGERFATENPATGQQLTDIAAGDAADIDLAVAAARRAFDDGRWSRRSPAERKAVLLRLADLIEANAEELAMLDSLEAGKPITDCRETDLPETIKTFRWYAEAVDKLYDSIAPTGRDALGMIIREPIGVVGAVLPWNFPIMMAAWKVGPVAGRRQQPGRQAGRAHLAQHDPPRRAGRPRPASPTASSTSSRGSARRPARRSGGTWTSTWCRSRARRRSVGCSSATRRRATSSGSSSSAAARARRS